MRFWTVPPREDSPPNEHAEVDRGRHDLRHRHPRRLRHPDLDGDEVIRSPNYVDGGFDAEYGFDAGLTSSRRLPLPPDEAARITLIGLDSLHQVPARQETCFELGHDHGGREDDRAVWLLSHEIAAVFRATDPARIALWNPHPNLADAVVIQYIGPASFA